MAVAQPQLHTVEELVKYFGGTKVVKKVLIANNGISAVKAIRSMRKWLYKILGNECEISFVVLATPDDMKINAEYIRMGTHMEEVPGGSNNKNYANVDLIVDLAERTGSDAVWAGWGHASENPRLPRALAATKSKIAFMGPHEKAMHDLGDKIASTLIAQSAHVPTVPWSGDGLIIDYEKEGLSDNTFKAACISSLADLTRQCDRIGFPVMLKASEGGGGKGIRKILSEDGVEPAYRQVQGEVPGSPIFLMKMVSKCHHLEVQVVADQYNNTMCLYGRDCSVQRRHQKIIEEAPAIVAPQNIRREMEKAAIRLAKAVRYVGVGTVEYLYSPETNEFFFLELNPRLQVEHPTTEQVTNVNIPAVQLCIAMGIPLYRIPDIRAFYGLEPFGDSIIDFDKDEPLPPIGHVIAARITGEDASEGFKPTSGRIHQLNFRSAPNVWGYFSVSGQDGGLHEFADSQFGHLFAHGQNREDARKSIILALKELSIRGDVHTPVEYLVSLLQTEEFQQNRMDTSSLDRFIQEKRIQEKKPDNILAVLCGAVFKAFLHFKQSGEIYRTALDQGQVPTSPLLPYFYIELIYNHIKYSLVLARTGPSKLAIRLAKVNPESSNISNLGDEARGGPIEAEFRPLGVDTLLILIDGRSHACHGSDEVAGFRFFVDDQLVMFTAENDPSVIRVSTSGKLVRYLVENGMFVSSGTAIAEMEVMKMYLPISTQESGTIRLTQNEGAQLQAGDLIARLDLANSNLANRVQDYEGKLPPMASSRTPAKKLHHRVQSIYETVTYLIAGYVPSHNSTEEIEKIIRSLVQMTSAPHLPYLVIRDRLTEVMEIVPSDLSVALEGILSDYQKALFSFVLEKNICADVSEESFVIAEMDRLFATPSDPPPSIGSPVYPVNAIKDAVTKFISTLTLSERNRILSLVSPAVEADETFSNGPIGYTQTILCRLLGQYCALSESKEWGDAKDAKGAGWGGWGEWNASIEIAFFKNKFSRVIHVICTVLKAMKSHGLIVPSIPYVTQVARLYGKSSLEVSLLARQMLIDVRSDSFHDRQEKLLKELSEIAIGSQPTEEGRQISEIQHKALIRRASSENILGNIYQSIRLDQDAQTRMHAMITSPEPLFDILLAILVTDVPQTILRAALEVYIQRAYRAYRLKTLKYIDPVSVASNKVVLWSHFYIEPEKEHFVQHAEPPLPAGGDMSPFYTFMDADEKGPLHTCQFLLLRTLSDFAETLPSILEQVKIDAPHGESEASEAKAIHNLHIVLFQKEENMTSDEVVVKILEELFAERISDFINHRIRRITVAFHRPEDFADYYTFVAARNFKENDVMRHIEPALGHRLELERMSNYRVKPVHTVGSRTAYIFYAEDKNLGRQGDARIFVRTLVRGTSDANDVLESNRLLAFIEQRLSECIKMLAMVLDRPQYSHVKNNHIFLSILPTVAYEPEAVNGIIKWLGNRYGNRLFTLKVSALEVRCRLATNTVDQAVPVLFEVLNPTSFKFHVHAYVEANDRSTGKGTLYGLEGLGLTLGALHGLPSRFAHNTISPIQSKRYQCQDLNTTYVYDFMELFELAVVRGWQAYGKQMQGTQEQKPSASEPSDVLSPDPFSRGAEYSKEAAVSVSQLLEMEKAATNMIRINRKVLIAVELVVEGKDTLVPVSRPPGSNSIGMVAWLVHWFSPEHPDRPLAPFHRGPSPFDIDKDGTEDEMKGRVIWDAVAIDEKKQKTDKSIWEYLKSHSYPNYEELHRDRAGKGRWMIVIANDMSVMYGSFGPEEDRLFYLASKFSRSLGIPRVYLSANSGARIGLAKEVQDLFRVRWASPANPKAGFEYLYLTDRDHKTLLSTYPTSPVIAVKENGCGCGRLCGDIGGGEQEAGAERKSHACVETGEVEEFHWKITDIIGAQDGLGVENLKGSGLIAGETSRAYDEIFTVTLVTGRSVGIGAYLVRLGQRAIQNQGPIILTGAPALNKVLGKDVYTSNVQLGGPQIMYHNGVSHIVVSDDLRGVQSIIDWLSYIPPCVGASPSFSPTFDSPFRSISFIPSDRPYDPRMLIEGGIDPTSGKYLSGLFDRNSFTETLSGWATTTICGRARLGGIPVGVVTVETRMREEIVPADPALPTSRQEVRQQPGQVWYPNTAYKTAQAIQDMNFGEELPLIILANWRGFSGGMRDMYNEILKYGSYIVDALKDYKQPVFVYLPPFAELRGGAWAVLDPTINSEMMEMYVDPRSRAGVLEPSGTVEIKYRTPDLLKTMHRLDLELAALDGRGKKEETSKDIRKREEDLISVYQQVAITFADLHDRSGRLLAKECVHGVIEWEHARQFFYTRLLRRINEERIIKTLIRDGVMTRAESVKILHKITAPLVQTDEAIGQWLTDHRNEVEKTLKDAIQERKRQQVEESLKSQDSSHLLTTLTHCIASLSESDRSALLSLISK